MNYGFERRENNNVIYYTAPMFEYYGAVNMFTTKFGGVSSGVYESLNFRTAEDEKTENIQENYRIALSIIGRNADNLICSNQVHENTIVEVKKADRRSVLKTIERGADGLLTAWNEAALSVRYADCLPVIFFDKHNKAAGAVHAGWRGTALDISGLMIDKMRELYNSKPENILAALGPCICQNCFETDENVPEAMIKSFGKAAEHYIRKQNGKWLVDIAGINIYRLEQSGIKNENITVSGLCTKCSGNEFWSHRATNGIRGVHAAFIGIR